MKHTFTLRSLPICPAAAKAYLMIPIRSRCRHSLVSLVGWLLLMVWLAFPMTARAQGFIQQTGAANPFGAIGTEYAGENVTLADLDGDSDLDLLTVDAIGNIAYYRNTGTPTVPSYLGATSPIGLPTQGGQLYLGFRFADLDGDGDQDAVTGNSDGAVLFYRNTGTRTSPSFTQLTGSSNPFAAFNYTNEDYSQVAPADFDGDGDVDVLVITGGGIHYLRNGGSATLPAYTEVTGTGNPFAGVVESRVFFVPAVADMDRDGDLDLAINSYLSNSIDYYQNAGTPTTPLFVRLTGPANPFNGFIQGGYLKIGLGDVDGDGDADAVVGGGEPLIYLRNVLQMPQQPTPASQTVCVGGSASTTVQARSGGAITYQWYRNAQNTTTPVAGQTTATLQLTNVQLGDAGVYYARATGGGGTLYSTAFSLTVNVTPVATLVATPAAMLSCAQTSLTLTAGGGTSYVFAGPGIGSQGGNQAVINAPGTYSVSVTSSGCSSTTSIAISQDNTAPVASLASSGGLSCSVTSVTLTASPDGQTYRFSAGAVPIGTTNQAMVTTAGIYSVTVSSANGCSSVASTTVTGDQTTPMVSINPGSATLTCANPSATLTAIGTGSFLWNTGARTATITVTTGGIYSVTLTGSNGCVATASAEVSSDQTPPIVSISPTSGTLTCASPTLILTANTNAPTLRWSNGQTTPTITVEVAGSYSVTAIGANGCSATSNSVLIESFQTAPPATLVASGELSCAVRSVTLTANAGSGLSYRFSTGATPVGAGNTATVNVAGTYSVTVTSTATGCRNTASVDVNQDNSQPTVIIDPTSATLTCGVPGVTLTANTTASSLTWSTGQTTSSISVSVASTYSVTVTSTNGCMAMAQATVSGTTSSPAAPTLAASPATSTTNQPITVTANGCTGGVINWTALGGSGQVSGNTYTLSQPGNYTLTATCSLNGCTSVASAPLAVQIRPGGFAITGVSMVNCQLIDEAKGGYQVQFTPQYAGQTNSPISFAVVNELAATTAPAPYSLRLYTDNPVITLIATQAGSGSGEARFAYNWLASCQSGTSPNQPPTTTGIPNQIILVGQGYQLQLTSYFTDPDGQALSFQTSGLSAGLTLGGSVISGAPSQTGVSSVNVTALDPGGLQVTTSFQLTVSPMPVTPPSGFAIVGVSTVSCQVISAGERRLTFTPQYAGQNTNPISFSVVNELVATTSPGPYSLNLYTDNPVITLSAQQGATVSTYRYNWLAVCTPAARVGSGEMSSRLTVRVLGNPVVGNSTEVEISGVTGQPVHLNLVDLQGKSVHAQRIEQAGQVERVSLPLGASNGVILLQVSTPTQRQQVKLLRTN